MSWEDRYARETEALHREKHRAHGRVREVGYPSHDESREALPLRANGIFQDQSGEALPVTPDPAVAPAARTVESSAGVRLYGAIAGVRPP